MRRFPRLFRRPAGSVWLLLAVAAGRAGGAGDGPVRIATEDPSSVQAGIVAAYRAGEKKVVVPPGVYRIGPVNKGWHLEFHDLADFEIEATGATFLWRDRTRGGIDFNRCRNVTLRGATLQHEIVPFTQGEIVAVGGDGKSYDLRIDEGYPANFDDPTYFVPKPTGYPFDPKTRQWKAGSHDMGLERIERLGEGLFRLHFGRSVASEPVVVGDRMAFRGTGRTDIHLGGCAGMTLADVTIRHGGGFCVHEAGGEGGGHYSFKVTYGPRPEGAKVDPLIACNADAFHSGGARKGPTLEGCSFEGMPDDGVAIHGYYEQIEHAEGNVLIVGSVGAGIPFVPGDPVRLYDREGAPAGQAVVTAVRPRNDVKASRPSELKGFKGRALHYKELTLDRSLPADFDFLVSDPNVCGSGFVVRNCTVRNHRARGMLLKADHGLVEGNTVDGSTIAGIVLAPELWWNEADYCHDVTIRGNTIRHTGYATSGPWSGQAGGLTITGEGGGEGNEGIRIEGNTFEDIRGVNLEIEHARDVLVKGNRFLGTHRQPCRNGRGRGIDPGAVVWLGECRDVVLEGNAVAGPGPNGSRAVVATPRAVHVSGLEGGVTVTAERR